MLNVKKLLITSSIVALTCFSFGVDAFARGGGGHSSGHSTTHSSSHSSSSHHSGSSTHSTTSHRTSHIHSSTHNYSTSHKSNSDVSVHSYTKRDGTFVPAHHRSHPDSSFNNNWSTVGNINPYTGKEGTKTHP